MSEFSYNIENLISRYDKILQIDEYLGDYSDDEPVRNRINMEGVPRDESIEREPFDPQGNSGIVIEGDSDFSDAESGNMPQDLPQIDPQELLDPLPERREPRTEPNEAGYLTPEQMAEDPLMDNPYTDMFFDASPNPSVHPWGNLDEIELPGNMRRNAHQRRRVPRGNRNRIPNSYRVKDDPRAYNDNTLDLDCVRDKAKEIHGWNRKMHIIVNTNIDKFQNMDTLAAYLEYHMTGNAANWWNTSPFVENIKKTAQSPNEFLDQLARLLINEFVGYNDIQKQEQVKQAEQAKAKYILENIQVCNICYWRQYVCEFEKWFYKLDKADQDQMATRFYQKLPPLWAIEMEKKFASKPDYICEGLAGRILLLEKEIEERCKTSAFEKSLGPYQNTPCCDAQMIDLPMKWGCRTGQTQRKGKRQVRPTKKRYRKFRPKYRKRRQNMPNKKPGFRKRRRGLIPPKGKGKNSDYCPRGKAECKCWLCQEEGHYANECPKRKKQEFKEKNKKLEVIYSMNFEPIESDTDEESVYDIMFEEEIITAYEKPGVDWETCSEESDWEYQ